MLPIVQFYHRNRPRIPAALLGYIDTCDLTDAQGDNAYLMAIKRHAALASGDDGIIVVEQDVAIDPFNLADIEAYHRQTPEAVIAVPYILWPESTQRDVPEWSHGGCDSEGRRISIPARANIMSDTYWFGLGCTYLPQRLISAAPDTEQSWDYPVLACRLSELARRLGIHVRNTQRPAVHLHWKKSPLCP